MNDPYTPPPLNNPAPVQIVRHEYEVSRGPQKTSGLAVAYMVLGILSMLGGCYFVLPVILAVVFGHIAVSQCNKDPNLAGQGMAVAGLVMGWIGLALYIVIVLFLGGLGVLGAALSNT